MGFSKVSASLTAEAQALGARTYLGRFDLFSFVSLSTRHTAVLRHRHGGHVWRWGSGLLCAMPQMHTKARAGSERCHAWGYARE